VSITCSLSPPTAVEVVPTARRRRRHRHHHRCRDRDAATAINDITPPTPQSSPSPPSLPSLPATSPTEIPHTSDSTANREITYILAYGAPS
jgi:hypothetical protein